jgi:hypothetical protein
VIAIFKQKTPANIFLLLIFGVLLKLPMFRDPYIPVARDEDGILFKAILSFLEPTGRNFAAIYPILTFGFIFLQAILLNRFINNQRMISKPTYFPAMAYMLITSLFPEWNHFAPPVLVNTILLLVLVGLFNIYNQQQARGAIFNIGLGLGVASFLMFSSVTFIIWILLALMVMRPFRLNEWLICIVGVTTPFYFYAIYLFITGGWDWNQIWPHFSLGLPALGQSMNQSVWLAGSAFLVVIPFLAGGYYVQDSLRRMLIQVRKGWSLLLLFLLGAIFLPFVNNTGNFENWVLGAIPLAAFHACTYLYAPLRIFPLLLFWLTVAFVLGYQYGGPGW